MKRDSKLLLDVKPGKYQKAKAKVLGIAEKAGTEPHKLRFSRRRANADSE
jgi:hypothetical protein